MDKQAATIKTASGRSRFVGDEAAEPAAALKFQKVAEGDKAEAGKGKRIARVSQEYIDRVLHEKATGTGAYKVSRFMEVEAILEQVRAGDAAILEQYHHLGYAYSEVEEDISFIYDKKICGRLDRSRPQPPQA